MNRVDSGPLASILVVLFVIVAGSPTVASDLKPMKDSEMSQVTGKTDLSAVIKEAQSKNESPIVLKEISVIKSNERLEKREDFATFLLENDLTQNIARGIARKAVKKPNYVASVAQDPLIGEMTEIASTTTNIAGNLIGNIPTGQSEAPNNGQGK